MSKAVLISIRPKWVEKIASGEKTIEVRKTRPKLATPFKAYLYVTAGNLSYRCPNGMICHCNGGRAVIGEYVCNKVDWITRIGFSGSPVPSRYSICSHSNMNVLPINDLLYAARLTYPELADYLAGGEGYGWHISGSASFPLQKTVWNTRSLAQTVGLAKMFAEMATKRTATRTGGYIFTARPKAGAMWRRADDG